MNYPDQYFSALKHNNNIFLTAGSLMIKSIYTTLNVFANNTFF